MVRAVTKYEGCRGQGSCGEADDRTSNSAFQRLQRRVDDSCPSVTARPTPSIAVPVAAGALGTRQGSALPFHPIVQLRRVGVSPLRLRRLYLFVALRVRTRYTCCHADDEASPRAPSLNPRFSWDFELQTSAGGRDRGRCVVRVFLLSLLLLLDLNTMA